MNTPRRFPVLIPLVALFFAVAHLALEHFTGGVQSHNLLNNPDLPAISNWLGLITLPLLGAILGLRVRAHTNQSRWTGIPISVITALVCAATYGAVLAIAFELGASSVTSIAFFGLFVCALLLPVYRAEYVMGFVMGMTFTFGTVLPLLVATVVAALSFVSRSVIGFVATRAGWSKS